MIEVGVGNLTEKEMHADLDKSHAPFQGDDQGDAPPPNWFGDTWIEEAYVYQRALGYLKSQQKGNNLRPPIAPASPAERFFRRYDKAIHDATALVYQGRKAYDQGDPITERFAHGEQTLYDMLHMKLQRIRAGIDGDDDRHVDDNLLDLINYAAFLWAWRRLHGNKEKQP